MGADPRTAQGKRGGRVDAPFWKWNRGECNDAPFWTRRGKCNDASFRYRHGGAHRGAPFCDAPSPVGPRQRTRGPRRERTRGPRRERTQEPCMGADPTIREGNEDRQPGDAQDRHCRACGEAAAWRATGDVLTTRYGVPPSATARRRAPVSERLTAHRNQHCPGQLCCQAPPCCCGHRAPPSTAECRRALLYATERSRALLSHMLPSAATSPRALCAAERHCIPPSAPSAAERR
jgi:hypothetical protein